MPNVVLEAMAAGAPVVCTDVEGIRELLPDHLPAAIVPPADAGELRAAIAAHLNAPNAQPASDRTSEYVSAKWFTTTRMVECYARLYRELLQNPGDLNV
jgi:glycosyltransferase involved in cell wall biosynthesis